MHLKKLEDYQSIEGDRALMGEINQSIEAVANLENVIRSQKVEVALAALFMFARPYSEYPFTPRFVEGIEIIDKLSPGGKLELACCLLKEVSDG